MGASEVIRKLLRIGSNGLYTRKNISATSHQLAHLTGTSVEPQLGLKPIYLRGQLYPRFFNGPVQCALFGGLLLKIGGIFTNRRV